MLQKGNRKLPKETLIFNLPSGKTCPNSTKDCRKWCYAKKSERMYPNVLPYREQNLSYSKQLNFTDKMVSTIKKAIKNAKIHKPKQVRIHESGDFYNQYYFDKWVNVAKELPDVTFYAYTKNDNLITTNKPDNFILILSKDDWVMPPHIMHYIKFDGIAMVDNKQKYLPNKDKHIVCPMDCKICNYCYTPSKDFKHILFTKH